MALWALRNGMVIYDAQEECLDVELVCKRNCAASPNFFGVEVERGKGQRREDRGYWRKTKCGGGNCWVKGRARMPKGWVGGRGVLQDQGRDPVEGQWPEDWRSSCQGLVGIEKRHGAKAETGRWKGQWGKNKDYRRKTECEGRELLGEGEGGRLGVGKVGVGGELRVQEERGDLLEKWSHVKEGGNLVGSSWSEGLEVLF
ncbi:unnamed protein product [Ilex paraguariensis]|uniref:Uncharacterized protein n=1 Tax=Ilex paraguariensis TaxID=185542 RepID=A0ABC8R1C4_9AQUA